MNIFFGEDDQDEVLKAEKQKLDISGTNIAFQQTMNIDDETLNKWEQKARDLQVILEEEEEDPDKLIEYIFEGNDRTLALIAEVRQLRESMHASRYELVQKNEINKAEADRLADQLREMDGWMAKKTDLLQLIRFAAKRNESMTDQLAEIHDYALTALSIGQLEKDNQYAKSIGD